METDSYVKVKNDSGSFVSDSYRNASLNGCVKSVAVGALVSDSGHVSNNNRTNGETNANIPNVDDAEGHEKTLQDNSATADCNSGSHETADFRECCKTHIALPNKVTPDPESGALDANAPSIHDQNSPAASVEEISSTLLQLAVAAEAADKLEVPSGEISGAAYGCSTDIRYIVYESERQMEDIMRLITKDLSEPYSIYTYRYFIHNWPRLCYLAMDGDKCVGAIVCKLDRHRSTARRGYIAMLAVDQDYRRAGIGSSLVIQAIKSMIDPINGGCDEVVLETEISNGAALRLYEKLGFVRDKRLFRYYLNGVDALRLKLWLK